VYKLLSPRFLKRSHQINAYRFKNTETFAGPALSGLPTWKHNATSLTANSYYSYPLPR